VLYVFNINREVVGSAPLEVRTKKIRARFDMLNANPNPLVPQIGPIAGGTACTIRGTRFHTGMRVRLGDKEVANLIIVSPTEATFISPEVFNERIVNLPLDLTIISDTGLEDALSQIWGYTLT
jgi:hypothetical protein